MWPKLLQEGLLDGTITLPEGVDKSEWILERSREIAIERTDLVYGTIDDTPAHLLAMKEAKAALREYYTVGGKTFKVQ